MPGTNYATLYQPRLIHQRCFCYLWPSAWWCSCSYFINLLTVQPGVSWAFPLRSTLSLRSCGSAQLCRFAPVAPLNFVASLLWLCSFLSLCSCTWLRSTLSLRSCGSYQLPYFPTDLSNPQITPLRNFVLLCTSVGLKQKSPLLNGKTYTYGGSPGDSLPFCFSRSSPCRAEARFFASPCGLCHSFNLGLSVTGSFALLVALHPNFFHCNFSQKLCEQSGSWARKKRQGSFLARAGCQLQRHVRHSYSVCGFLD